MTQSPGQAAPSDNRPRVRADASARRVARVYAEALLDEAMAQGAADEVRAELEQLLQRVAGADPLLASFFLGGVVGRASRASAIKAAFEGRASPILVNFLLVLNDHDRIELLRPVAEAYAELLEERTGKVPVTVRSAVPLTDEQRQRLVQQIRETSGREPVLDEAVDPALLGGLIVQVGDYRYDASVRTKLDALRNQLIERSSYAIQTGRDRFSSPV
jgi:F-type H+-transporting ATPase subunit delta